MAWDWAKSVGWTERSDRACRCQYAAITGFVETTRLIDFSWRLSGGHVENNISMPEFNDDRIQDASPQKLWPKRLADEDVALRRRRLIAMLLPVCASGAAHRRSL